MGTTSVSASTISRQLRSAGFPMGRSASYCHEGVKVRQGRGVVSVVADFDSPQKAERIALLALVELREHGYEVENQPGDSVVFVTGRR